MSFLKKLNEQREEKALKMEELLTSAKTEERAMSTEETARFDILDTEIASIDATIKAEQRARLVLEFKPASENETAEQIEERAFVDFVLENRAGEKNMDMGSNGAIIPISIANKIIKAVKDICPIFKNSTMFNVKGKLKIPVWGDKFETT